MTKLQALVLKRNLRREYKYRFLRVAESRLTVIVHQTLTSFFSKSLRKHIGTFGNQATILQSFCNTYID